MGPYETVTLRSTDDDALRAWLKSHDYAIPDSIAPTIDAYVREGFDFIALRLRPGCGERSMQPVRVVTKGADPTLPLCQMGSSGNTSGKFCTGANVTCDTR